MSTFVNFLILLIVLIGVIVAMVYITRAAIAVAAIPNYGSDTNLAQAHRYLAWTASISWIILAVLIVGIGLLLVYGSEVAFLWGGVLIIGLVFLMIAFALANGVIAALSASYIRASNKYSTSNGQTAYYDSVVAASVSLGIVGILTIAAIIYYVHSYRASEEHNEAERRLLAFELRQQLEEQKVE